MEELAVSGYPELFDRNYHDLNKKQQSRRQISAAIEISGKLISSVVALCPPQPLKRQRGAPRVLLPAKRTQADLAQRDFYINCLKCHFSRCTVKI